MSSFGNYDLVAPLGAGGMAAVYQARVREGRRAGQTVALKCLHRSLTADAFHRELFSREASLAQLLHHPHILKVFEAGELNGVCYMAMEFVDGTDLGQVLARCQERKIPLPLDFAVYLGAVLLQALDYAHQAKGPRGRSLGIVHCDVSPSNLFVSRDGQIKLGDFGVARSCLDGPQGHQVAGKPGYASPEMLEGQLTPMADLWAAAVVLYELIALQRPFEARSEAGLFKRIRKAKWTPLRKVRRDAPAALEALFQRAFARAPEDRYVSASAFVAALEPLYDPGVGTPLGIAALVRGLLV